jgi:hypothetical protein
MPWSYKLNSVWEWKAERFPKFPNCILTNERWKHQTSFQIQRFPKLSNHTFKMRVENIKPVLQVQGRHKILPPSPKKLSGVKNGRQSWVLCRVIWFCCMVWSDWPSFQTRLVVTRSVNPSSLNLVASVVSFLQDKSNS